MMSLNGAACESQNGQVSSPMESRTIESLTESINLFIKPMQDAHSAQTLPSIITNDQHLHNAAGDYVYVLVPNILLEGETRTEAERLSHNYGKERYVQELALVFAEIGRKASIHLCRMADYKKVIDRLPKGAAILNLCDGSDSDGVPGPCVARYLEEQNIPFYGCDEYFMNITTRKQTMKKDFEQYGVSTAKYVVVEKGSVPTLEDLDDLMFPLFVKADDSYGSIGLSKDSVCYTYEQLQTQLKKMFECFKVLVVEEFILGKEYSVLIIGDDKELDVYPPCQRVFDASIALKDQFLSFKLVWEEGGVRYQYHPVDAQTAEVVGDLAKRAYLSLKGNGFGRVDIRERISTHEFFVLEVNATCGIGYDSTSGEILKRAGLNPSLLLQRLLEIG